MCPQRPIRKSPASETAAGDNFLRAFVFVKLILGIGGEVVGYLGRMRSPSTSPAPRWDVQLRAMLSAPARVGMFFYERLE